MEDWAIIISPFSTSKFISTAQGKGINNTGGSSSIISRLLNCLTFQPDRHSQLPYNPQNCALRYARAVSIIPTMPRLMRWKCFYNNNLIDESIELNQTARL